jgi:hypothetical protein
MQGAKKLKSEAHLSRVSRDNDEGEAQSRSERDRWTFSDESVYTRWLAGPCFIDGTGLATQASTEGCTRSVRAFLKIIFQKEKW